MESQVDSDMAMAMNAQAKKSPLGTSWGRTIRVLRQGGQSQQYSPSSILSEEGSAEKRAEESSSYPSYRATGAYKSPSLCPSSMQAIASGAHNHTSESSAVYFHWPALSRLHGTAEERAAYFSGLQKDIPLRTHTQIHDRPETDDTGMPQQASTLLDLMTIRAFHSKLLRRFSLGTTIGFRNRNGMLTDIPAIIVFVARKVDKEWLHELQLLPPVLEGPGGIWCDVDVVEFSYYGTPAIAPKEQVYTELVEGLRGNDPCIGSGSQVASQETYGTLGAIVQSRTGLCQVGFLANRHVAVDLDYPNQKMFHPLPPNLGPGVYLGAVERATSFITDDLWYGIFASMNPETFVRADGAFIPFDDHFDMSRVTTIVKGVGNMGEVMVIDLQAPVGCIVGRQVMKVGRSSGLTTGRIMAYALEYNDEKGICFFTDFLIVGDSRRAFDLEGDSGSLILLKEGDGEKPRPVGIIWGGTANRGCLKLRNGYGPENWTSGVDLGRLLDLLQLSLITRSDLLAEAVQEQRHWLVVGPSQVNGARGGSGRIQQERSETSQQAASQETSHPHITTTASPQPQQLPVTILVGTINPSSSKPLMRELELMDFSLAMQDGPSQVMKLENKAVSPSHDSSTEEASTSLQLFDGHGKKRPSTGS